MNAVSLPRVLLHFDDYFIYFFRYFTVIDAFMDHGQNLNNHGVTYTLFESELYSACTQQTLATYTQELSSNLHRLSNVL